MKANEFIHLSEMRSCRENRDKIEKEEGREAGREAERERERGKEEREGNRGGGGREGRRRKQQ